MTNEKIISEFERLKKQIGYDIDQSGDDKKERTRNLFRLKTIDNALEKIKKFSEEIKSSKQLEELSGIGKGIMKRIDEILETGKLQEITYDMHDTHNKDYDNSLDNLLEVYGIGDKLAHELVTKYNIKNIDDLKREYENGKIELSNNILMGLKYYGAYKQKIPRSEMRKMDIYLHRMVQKIHPKLDITICGSYRRKKPFSNDIDCMITHPDIITYDDLHKENYLEQLVKLLRHNKFIVDSLTSDQVVTKYMGFCKSLVKESSDIRRIDIRYIPMESYHSALLYFTGSGKFNQIMRRNAKKKGYKLSEYGLYEITGSHEKKIKVTSEEDIFRELGMDYVKPEDRDIL
jgi:DNA polymerase/3'-5' exonuclease PolX